jgi:hypothetical protein
LNYNNCSTDWSFSLSKPFEIYTQGQGP